MTNQINVFYTDKSNGWCAQQVDENSYQVGEAAYHYRKADAIAYAKASGHKVCVFGRNGLHQRTLVWSQHNGENQ